METTTRNFKWLNAVALMLVLPAACFILISLLKYNFGIEGPYDSIYPWLEQAGIKQSLGWNINLLILFGPVLAFLLAVLQVLWIDWHFTREQFDVRITLQRKLFPLLLLGVSGLVLTILCIYLVTENFLTEL